MADSFQIHIIIDPRGIAAVRVHGTTWGQRAEAQRFLSKLWDLLDEVDRAAREEVAEERQRGTLQ
jgi:hypothetical protein